MSISFVLGVTWRVVALAGLVYLTLAAVLRARELYADVRASVWDGPSGALARVLSAQQLAGEGRWRALRRFHPEPERRRQTIASTDQLVRMGFWDAFATGITAVVAVPPFSDVLGLIIDHSELLSLSTLAVLMGAPLSRVLAVLLVAPLAVGVVGLGAWRGAFVALARGEPPSGSGALALGLGLGLIAGTPLSLSATVSTGSRMDWGALLAPSSTTTLVVYAVLSALLLVGLVWLLRWISAGASAWLDVVTTRRSLRSIVSLSLVTAGLISVLWLSPLLWLFLSPNSPLELVSPSQLAYLQSPYILLALIALWVLPLAASRWQVKKVLPPATQWAFLDPSPQPLSSRHHNRFRLSWALKAGIIGGAALCALLLIARLWWISVPEGVKSTDQAQLAFFAGQVAAAAVMQTIVAAIVTIRVRWLGVLHGLFAAFVGGCVMAVGLLGLNVAFGGGIGASFAWITIAFVLNGGALMALAISGSVSAAASRTRRKQIRT